MATHSSHIAAPRTRARTTAHSWGHGFGNLLRKEYSLWWGTRKWLVHVLIWLGIINGLIALVTFEEAGSATPSVSAISQEVIEVFFKLGALATTLGLVTSVQGAIVGEKQLGTAAWLMSKPVARSAFVLSKLVANATAFVALAVALPATVFYAQNLLMLGYVTPLAPFLAGLAVQMLHLLFYLALTLMLGTLFDRRGPVAGIALGILFAGLLLPNFLPAAVTLALPWQLSEVMTGLALGRVMPAGWLIPVVATALWTVLFIAVALWRFGREEF